MKISVCTVAGKTHKEGNRQCEDISGVYNQGKTCIAVISDGAGSKKMGLEAAKIIVKNTIDYWITINFDFLCFDKESFTEYINNAFKINRLNSDDAGGTMIFFVTDGKEYIIGHMGDGIVLKKSNGEFVVESFPENGEFANQTYFFPAETSDHFRVCRGKVTDDLCVILTSDGIAGQLCQHSDNMVASACYKLDEWNRKYDDETMQEILKDNLENVFALHTSDDMSIAVISNLI